MPSPANLEGYSRDRRRLLDLVLSSFSSPAPDLAGVDLDAVSVDYALECVSSGAVFDPEEATRRYYEEMRYPIMISLKPENPYFYLSTPEMAGSPPARVVPSAKLGTFTKNETCAAGSNYVVDSDVVLSRIDILSEAILTGNDPSQHTDDVAIISNSEPSLQTITVDLTLDLPALSTELKNDDIRDTAYEVLVASLLLGGRVHFTEKKEKRSKFLKSLSFRREHLDAHTDSRDLELLDAIRAQMEIAETMDILTREGLKFFGSKGTLEQIIVPHISLELLSSISRLDFPSQRLRMKWRNRQANILEELLLCFASNDSNMSETLRILLTKLRSSEDWTLDVRDGHVEVLTVINRYLSKLTCKTGQFCKEGKTCNWIKIYYFNVLLYENLLESVFDVLEDGQLVEAADDIIEVIKETWHVFCFTPRLHHALYAWVLFKKFVQTGDNLLLKLTIHEIQKVLSSNDDEELEMGHRTCSEEPCSDSRIHLNLVDTIFSKMNMWCCNLLADYHLNFNQENNALFEDVLTLAILSKICSVNGSESETSTEAACGPPPEHKLIQEIVAKSIEAVYKRVICLLDGQSMARLGNCLAVVANELIVVAENEYSKFTPILCKVYSEAGILALIFLHELYGEQLSTFLEGTDLHLENVKEVLVSSTDLELCLANKLKIMYGQNVNSSLGDYLHPYQIKQYSAPLILQWLHAQHDRIMEWTKRAIEMEDWEPLSVLQKQATSAVEVFRIVEETIDQFISLHIPMDTVHLRCLLIGVARFLEVYLQHVANEQVSKTVLYPSAPVLTRYTDYATSFTKRKVVEATAVDEKMEIKLGCLTVSKLCMKLNTLHFIRDQLDSVEETIKQSWDSVQSAFSLLDYLSQISTELAFVEDILTSESVDELFTIFDDVKRNAIDTSNMILDFIGPRVIYWDLRDSFVFSLYRDCVESSRLETFIPLLDQVLDQICDIIIDELRDETVLRVFKASLEGYVWVLLDGGPSRAYSEEDVELMRDDLIMLKELFLANGEGLAPDLVEEESMFAKRILDLYELKAESVIELLLGATGQASIKFLDKVGRKKPMADAQILLRVLCHKKEKGASEFLKTHYQLAKSSDYEDIRGKAAGTRFPPLANMRSFNSLKSPFGK